MKKLFTLLALVASVIGLLVSFLAGVSIPLETYLRGSPSRLIRGATVRIILLIRNNLPALVQLQRCRSEMVAELVKRPVAVLVTGADPAAVAGKQATATIPIVFVVGGDPLRSGIVTGLHRPGANMTGVSLFISE